MIEGAQYTPPAIHGIDFSNPDHVRDYELSQNKAIQAAFAEVRRVGNNPLYIRIGGESLQDVVRAARPWSGDLKFFDGSLSSARSWGRKYGWDVCDGTKGTPDLRSKFVRGAARGKDAGATGGCGTGSFTCNLVVGGAAGHDHSFTPAGSIPAHEVTACYRCGAGTGALGVVVSVSNLANTFTGSAGTTGKCPLTPCVTSTIATVPPHYDVIILRKR